MANTAKFDREEVVNKATNLYWQKGFHATSMRNLQDEINMRPGSIYAAFGSKNGLFKEAILHYTDMGLMQIAKYQSNYDSPTEALIAFIKNVVVSSQENAPNGMCMLSKTIAELTDEHQELVVLTRECLRELELAFKALIIDGQACGEINKTSDPEYLASFIQVQIAGLRAYAKTNADVEKLNKMIDGIFTHYPFEP